MLFLLESIAQLCLNVLMLLCYSFILEYKNLSDFGEKNISGFNSGTDFLFIILVAIEKLVQRLFRNYCVVSLRIVCRLVR